MCITLVDIFEIKRCQMKIKKGIKNQSQQNVGTVERERERERERESISFK